MYFLVSPTYKICFLDAPRKGSSSLKAMLLNIEYSIDYRYIKKEIKKYTTKRLTTIKPPPGYKIYTCVRNPFSWLYSYYYNGRFRERFNISFTQFLFKIKKINEEFFWFYRCKKIVEMLPEDTILFRFETFSQSLQNILISNNITNVKVPCYHTHPNRKNYREVYNKLQIKIVKKLYQWELLNLGYSFDGYHGPLPTTKELKQNLAH